jgi:hypothetical protein
MLQEAAQAAGSLLSKLEIDAAVTKLQAKSVVAAGPIIRVGANRAKIDKSSSGISALMLAVGGRVSPCPICSGPSAMDLKPHEVN